MYCNEDGILELSLNMCCSATIVFAFLSLTIMNRCILILELDNEESKRESEIISSKIDMPVTVGCVISRLQSAVHL